MKFKIDNTISNETNNEFNDLSQTVVSNGNTFTVFTKELTWAMAAKRCRQENLELAQVENLADASAIFDRG